MIKVNVTEFRRKLPHYIKLCSTEEILITKRGKVVAVLSNPDSSYYNTLFKLYGCLEDGGENYNDMIGEEIMKRCGY